jgi:hypothetical protein
VITYKSQPTFLIIFLNDAVSRQVLGTAVRNNVRAWMLIELVNDESDDDDDDDKNIAMTMGS